MSGCDAMRGLGACTDHATIAGNLWHIAAGLTVPLQMWPDGTDDELVWKIIQPEPARAHD